MRSSGSIRPPEKSPVDTSGLPPAQSVPPARPTGELHHIEIYVSDLARTIDFWGHLLESFGYVVYQDWDRGRSWRKGDTYLVFVATDETDPAFDRRRVGLNHLAFHAAERSEVDRLREELSERGVRILYPELHPDPSAEDYYALFFEDPDGIKVEVVAP